MPEKCQSTLHALDFVSVPGYVSSLFFLATSCCSFPSDTAAVPDLSILSSVLTGLFTQLAARRSNGNFSPAFNLIDGALTKAIFNFLNSSFLRAKRVETIWLAQNYGAEGTTKLAKI